MTHFALLTAAAALAAKPPRPGDWSFGWAAVASIAAVALAIIVCLWTITKYFSAQRERNSNSPWQLFIDLCKAHKLSRRERRLLQRLAGQHPLDQPAMLFVEPSWFSADKIGPNCGCHFDELFRLRNRLFPAH
ncbi:MAG TPA: hypothetical protein VGI40_05170 [Pirellulaceae bacterium]